ncbi:MAG: hypothetical protein N3E49_05030 [Bacteroidia bacterium]|nr:hypothetical protein [Bacteroidia bacterium]
MRRFISLQICTALAQGVVSPVAFLPESAISQGYRVIAEVSRGWVGPTLPFYEPGSWRLSQSLKLQTDSVILYIEGAVGKVSVYQDKRLLWRGEHPTLWIPLIGRGTIRLQIKGETGGITGGIYLLARSDTQAWPREPYPPPVPLCKTPSLRLNSQEALSLSPLNRTSGLCVGYDFYPPARIQKALLNRQHSLSQLSSSPADSASNQPLSQSAFVLMAVGLALLSAALPSIYEGFWKGMYASVPSGPIEALLSLLWISIGILMAAMCMRATGVFWLFLGFMVIESLTLRYFLRRLEWVWQSWLLPTGLILIVSFLAPKYVFWSLVALWALRALRLILYFPRLTYLCTGEAFLAILLISP